MVCESEDHGEDRVFCIESKVFFHRKAFASRGATCWRFAERKYDDRYILKDSWRGVNHASEITVLLKAMERDVQGIVEVIAFEEVIFDGKLDDIRENIMSGLQVGKHMNLKLFLASLDAVESSADSVSRAALHTPSYSPYPLEGGVSRRFYKSFPYTERWGASSVIRQPQSPKPRVVDWPQHQHRINPGVLPEARCLPHAPRIPSSHPTTSRIQPRPHSHPHASRPPLHHIHQYAITPSCFGSPV